MNLFILLGLLITFSIHAQTQVCGKEGSLQERITSCNLSKGEFVLVVRDESGVEIYQDTKSGLLWGDRISSEFNNYGSQKACADDLVEKKLFKEVSWRLPTVRDFQTAAARGMKEALPKMTYTFWTSTPVKASWRVKRRKGYTAQAYMWNGEESKTDFGDLRDAGSVRCVGNIPKR